MRPITNKTRIGGALGMRVQYEAQKGLCPLCDNRLPPLNDLTHPSDRITVDHIIPLSRGGTDDRSNLQLTHHRCNQAKGSKLAEELSRPVGNGRHTMWRAGSETRRRDRGGI